MSRGEIIELLESLRLKEKPEEKPKESNGGKLEKTDIFSNDPMLYSKGVPFLLYDEDSQTIIDRTAKAINEVRVNPFSTNWMEVTLYETVFVRQLLEIISSEYILDVAEAIDDEDERHAREDGQFTNIASDYYGTGQGSANFYSYKRDNWQNDSEYVSAGTIAEGILDKRKKAEAFRQKTKEKTDGKTAELKRHIVEITDEPGSHLHVNLKESVIDRSIFEENNKLKKECFEWQKKYKEALANEPEKAFTASGNECFYKS